MKFSRGQCTICFEGNECLMPLHGDEGGPPVCLLCRGKWHAEHGRRRNRGRIVIRAMKAYEEAGGKWKDFDKLKLSALLNVDPLRYLDSTADTNDLTIELTSELVNDVIQLTHPDKHPPERRELAQRVSAQLIALKPFVFPAPKAKPPPAPTSEPVTDQSWSHDGTEKKLLRFPCTQCADTIPKYYCASCQAEQERRWEAERKRESEQRRKWYARRKERLARWKRPTLCASCGAEFKGKRKDAKFCSDRCRKGAHRRSVTDKTNISRAHQTAVT